MQNTVFRKISVQINAGEQAKWLDALVEDEPGIPLSILFVNLLGKWYKSRGKLAELERRIALLEQKAL